MPELPEVETTCQGLKKALCGQAIVATTVRNSALRYPVNADLADKLINNTIIDLYRRAKYLILRLNYGHLLIHLGMSGHLRMTQCEHPAKKHDHIDIELCNNSILRYHDPRRFGIVLWFEQAPEEHPLLNKLGPEPLLDEFNADYLFKQCSKRKSAIKTIIMNNQVVVGVGNIYACESLFKAKIHPKRSASTLKLNECQRLVDAIKLVLTEAIKQGGTTLKDFFSSDGKPGYFSQSLAVYGRQGNSCYQCKQELLSCKIGQRNTVYCNHCQR